MRGPFIQFPKSSRKLPEYRTWRIPYLVHHYPIREPPEESLYREYMANRAILNLALYSDTQAEAESVRRAIYTCAPYFLPASQYDIWRTITLVFDRRMLSGATP
jgi:hypothetical protein